MIEPWTTLERDETTVVDESGNTVAAFVTADDARVCCNAVQCLRTVQGLLDGREWSPSTLDYIADALRDAGFDVGDTES